MQKHNLNGLATGIGSLPHKDAEVALDLIFRYLPHIPFWPQLPRRDGREGMVAQFSENLPCLEFAPEGLFFNPQDKEKKLEAFYERIIAQDHDYFKISPDFACSLYKFYQRLEKADLKNISYVKCQVTGPFTFAAGINNENGVSLLYDKIFMQAVLKGLAMKALWQINLFRKFGKKIILFFDEPYLGCFGSAYTPINREDVINGLREITEGLRSKDVLLGVHCCGNTDWSIFTDAGNIDIISFDAFGFLDKIMLYAHNLKAFTERGGILCWGIVPTQEFSGQESVDSLLRKIKQGIGGLVNKGLNKDLLVNNLLLSPACGLGMLDQGVCEKIFGILSQVSVSMKKSF